MTDSVELRAGQPQSIGSARFRLARLARDAALLVPGVVGTDTGALGTFITVGGGERLEGVLCVATIDGGYEVTLRLICRMVPLPQLSEEVKAAVVRVAERARLCVSSVIVHVAGLAEIEEL
jgi:hypothetical protein